MGFEALRRNRHQHEGDWKEEKNGTQKRRHGRVKRHLGRSVSRPIISPCTRREQMLKNTRLQMIAMLAIGGLFGYAAASGKLDVFRKANAGPPQPSVADKERSSVQAATSTCCLEGAPKAELVAMADPKVTNTAAGFQANGKKPNIVFIMGDDIGMWNIGAYHRGLMAGQTPNLDKMAKEGMLFTDYYAEASCTAGRANFITGELPIRTGMTTVGQAGAKTGLPAEACTIATALKSLGYATG